MCVFNTEVTTFPRAASPPIPLWLAHMAWNLFCDPRVDVLGRRGIFFSTMILACRGQGRPQQYILAVWIPFIRPRALLPPRRGSWT